MDEKLINKLETSRIISEEIVSAEESYRKCIASWDKLLKSARRDIHKKLAELYGGKEFKLIIESKNITNDTSQVGCCKIYHPALTSAKNHIEKFTVYRIELEKISPTEYELTLIYFRMYQDRIVLSTIDERNQFVITLDNFLEYFDK